MAALTAAAHCLLSLHSITLACQGRQQLVLWPRWPCHLQVPGQALGVRLPGTLGAVAADGASGANTSAVSPSSLPKECLFHIASTPYASRRDSAYVDASIIEVRRAP
jgi:hypothetical protein